jgi:hypothetical protein
MINSNGNPGAFFLLMATLSSCIGYVAQTVRAEPIKVLIVSGQNNHDWEKSHRLIAKILDSAKDIETTVSLSPKQNSSKDLWNTWRPEFSRFDVVLLDYNGEQWPEEVKKSFIDYVKGGGSVLLVHAANNSFSGWKEYEEMVGLLWRGSDFGDSLYIDDQGNTVRESPGKGRGMGHGGQYPWFMTTRDLENPITKDMPKNWFHAKDELYHGQRGPAKNVHILLTAYSDPTSERNGTGKNEPIVFWVPYGKGKCLTNLMAHVGDSTPMECVGFKTVLIRSVEWLARGECQTPLPKNFPTKEVVVEPIK